MTTNHESRGVACALALLWAASAAAQSMPEAANRYPSKSIRMVIPYAAKIRMTHVPYTAIPAMTTDIIGGQIDLGFPAAPSASG